VTLQKWLVVGVCIVAMTLVGCVAPSSKTCESDEDCFAGEVCGPGGQCIADMSEDGETMDTGPSEDGTGDAGDTGGEPDSGRVSPPTDFYYFTSGGGTGMSSSYDIQVRVGAPSPGFRGDSENYRLRLAPVRP